MKKHRTGVDTTISISLLLVAALLCTLTACWQAKDRARPTPVAVSAEAATASSPQCPWDLGAAELLSWQADEPQLSPAHAVEASGLAIAGNRLLIVLEKYAMVLQVTLDGTQQARVLRIGVPLKTELEGISVAGDRLYLCDEATAGVFEVSLAAGEPGTPAVLPAQRLVIEGVELPAGKIGLEGIAIEPESNRVYLTLERGAEHEGGCAAYIYRFQRAGARLRLDGEPLPIPLAGCDWRLTDLALWQGKLLTLRTRYPDKRYELLTIDPETGALAVLAELTDLMAMLHRSGYGDNLEGLAVGPDGSLYLVSDNAQTGVITDPIPPRAKEPTLLLRLPPRHSGTS